MTAMTTAQLLRKTARQLATGEITWGREEFVNRATGCRCLLGALTFAADPYDRDGDPQFNGDALIAAGMLADYLVVDLGATEAGDRTFHGWVRDVVETVGNWNDEDGRTLADVVAALEGAADRIDARTAVTA